MALTLVALAACGDAYSTQAPTQKLQSTMVLTPDHARAGEELELHAVIFTPELLNYVSDFDFGPQIEVMDFDSGAGLGCDRVDTSGIEVPDLFHPTEVFPLCLTALAQDTADAGERTVAIEVQSNGTPVVARAEFYLLPAFPSP